MKSLRVIIIQLLITITNIYSMKPKKSAENIKNQRNSENQFTNSNHSDQLKIKYAISNDCDTNHKTKNGDRVRIHYHGFLLNASNKEFDHSHMRNTPMNFILGKQQYVKGWDVGLLDMCPGDRRILKIGPKLAFGEKGSNSGKVPPNTWVKYEVDLISFERDGENYFNDRFKDEYHEKYLHHDGYGLVHDEL